MARHRLLWIFLFSLISSDILAGISANDTLSDSETSRFLVFPFGIRSPETKWGIGLATAFFFKANQKETDLRTSDVNIVALATQKQQLVLVLNAVVFSSMEKRILRMQTSYSYYPDKTWGIGNHSPEDSKESYDYKQFFFNPQILHRLHKNLYLGASYEFQHIHDFSYTAGGVFDSQHIAGKNGGKVGGFGLLLTWDKRNNAYSPSKGFFAELNFTSFDREIGSDYGFTTLTFDIRKFIPWRTNSVLALQGIYKSSEGNIPIRNLSALGGPEIMRGYYKGRFADKSYSAIQAEWRQYLFWRMGVVGFVGAGEVSPELDQYSLPGIHFTYGCGLRLMIKEREKLNLRIDYGWSKESHGLYVMIKEAF
ncbi:MAG: BamA/TamA family outer membrane protein [Bacteroidetes bacterium]|nr:BamA/TamA family outer membrane protein [Bacteroidota bacterium]